MADFAKAIGIDRASIYYYISGKEELYQEIIHEAVQANVNMIEAIRDSDDAPNAKIRNLIVGLMSSFEEHYPYLYAYVQEDVSRITKGNTSWAREMKRLADRFSEAAFTIIEQGIKEGTIQARGAPAQMIAFAVIGMCSWSHRWFRPSGELSAETIGQHFANIVLNGLLPERQASMAIPRIPGRSKPATHR